MSKIILASASPRRRELLERIGVTDFEVRAPEVDENFPEGLSPEETVQFISREKAEAAREQWGLEPIIICGHNGFFGRPPSREAPQRGGRVGNADRFAGPASYGLHRGDGKPGGEDPDGGGVNRGHFPARGETGASFVYRHGRTNG